MPKNPYQRPSKPMAAHAVPRHGAPLPPSSRKAGRLDKRKAETALPANLEDLLKAPALKADNPDRD
jgi:hypothetical protein